MVVVSKYTIRSAQRGVLALLVRRFFQSRETDTDNYKLSVAVRSPNIVRFALSERRKLRDFPEEQRRRGKGVGVWGRDLGPLVPPPERRELTFFTHRFRDRPKNWGQIERRLMRTPR